MEIEILNKSESTRGKSLSVEYNENLEKLYGKNNIILPDKEGGTINLFIFNFILLVFHAIVIG